VATANARSCRSQKPPFLASPVSIRRIVPEGVLAVPQGWGTELAGGKSSHIQERSSNIMEPGLRRQGLGGFAAKRHGCNISVL